VARESNAASPRLSRALSNSATSARSVTAAAAIGVVEQIDEDVRPVSAVVGDALRPRPAQQACASMLTKMLRRSAERLGADSARAAREARAPLRRPTPQILARAAATSRGVRTRRGSRRDLVGFVR
jgi:hypothetical protein